jgi:hypothetical protein
MPTINLPNFDQVELAPPQLAPGEYMMSISQKPEIKTNPNGKQYLEVRYKVIEGPEQQKPDPGTGSKDPTGRVVPDRYYLVEGAEFRIKRLLVSTGIIARDDKESPVAQGNFNTDILMGVKLPVNVTIQMNNGKEYRNYDPVV